MSVFIGILLRGGNLVTDGQMALSTILTVGMFSHKDTIATSFSGALLTETNNLSGLVNAVIL